jgi:hypothetical protein
VGPESEAQRITLVYPLHVPREFSLVFDFAWLGTGYFARFGSRKPIQGLNEFDRAGENVNPIKAVLSCCKIVTQ